LEYLQGLFQVCRAGFGFAELCVALTDAFQGVGLVIGLVGLAGQAECVVMQRQGLCGVAGGGDLGGVVVERPRSACVGAGLREQIQGLARHLERAGSRPSAASRWPARSRPAGSRA
jgi:hypothetical protein